MVKQPDRAAGRDGRAGSTGDRMGGRPYGVDEESDGGREYR